MKVLIACEESQVVCKAFRERGHEAYSCDIQECSGGYPEWHIQDDALLMAYSGKWDLMIAFPPCTYLSYAGIAHWNKPGRLEKRIRALQFFGRLYNAPIEKICLENPKGCASPTIAKYSQEIQPYYFGDPHVKTTWLWLKNLPPLVHIERDNLFERASSLDKPQPLYIHERKPGRHYVGGEIKKRYFVDRSGAHSAKNRSKTFPGIAKAMAEQWG